MGTPIPLGFLGDLARVTSGRSRSITAENPTGAKGGGARATWDPAKRTTSGLGTGWKVRPCIELEHDTTYTLADIEGPGTITHIWITAAQQAMRECILRIWWDEEPTPSVECPLGDFFAQGHGVACDVTSLVVNVNPTRGLNCFWPMPFRQRCRITLQNERWELEKSGPFFYQIDYELGEVPADAAYFHAQWRRSVPSLEQPEHVILDGVRGAGHYVGTYLAWTQLNSGWWGEGEVKFFIDGDAEFPTICGTGTEDYVGGAWCFADRTYSAPFMGYPQRLASGNDVPKHGLYRWHILDPVRFAQDLRVTVQALGWWPLGGYRPLQDDIASTAFWYQVEPHAAFPALPPLGQRFPR
jgi:hypothetical protein